MGGFFSKQANTTEALLNANNQAADYQSLKTTPRDNPREVVQQSINAILKAVEDDGNISEHDNCLSVYLRFLDKNYYELNQEAAEHVNLLIKQVGLLLSKHKKPCNKTIIESTLGNAVQTLQCLSESHGNQDTEEKHNLFKPLASHIITKKNLKEITAKYLEYKSEPGCFKSSGEYIDQYSIRAMTSLMQSSESSEQIKGLLEQIDRDIEKKDDYTISFDFPSTSPKCYYKEKNNPLVKVLDLVTSELEKMIKDAARKEADSTKTLST